MKALYVESSVLGRAFLHGDHEAHAALHSASRGRLSLTSALTRTELRRAVQRGLAEGRWTAKQAADAGARISRALSRMDVVAITPEILERAGTPWPCEYVGTLDAIHLATALEISRRDVVENVVLLSRDQRVRENAMSLGLDLA